MQTRRRKRTVSRTKKKTTRVTVDFPVNQHRKLKAIAALEGVTLQEYIRSRVISDPQEEDISDSELNPLVAEIIKENKVALKRLADK